jgi:hypothetical protein
MDLETMILGMRRQFPVSEEILTSQRSLYISASQVIRFIIDSEKKETVGFW